MITDAARRDGAPARSTRFNPSRDDHGQELGGRYRRERLQFQSLQGWSRTWATRDGAQTPRSFNPSRDDHGPVPDGNWFDNYNWFQSLQGWSRTVDVRVPDHTVARFQSLQGWSRTSAQLWPLPRACGFNPSRDDHGPTTRPARSWLIRSFNPSRDDHGPWWTSAADVSWPPFQSLQGWSRTGCSGVRRAADPVFQSLQGWSRTG